MKDLTVKVDISPRQFTERLEIFARLYGYSVAQVFYAQGALLCQWMAARMFPRSEGAGKGAVRTDLMKAFGRIPTNMRTWEADGKRHFAPRSKDDKRKPFSIDPAMYSPNGDRMADHHRRNQRKSTGRFIDRGWQVNRMFVKNSQRNKYIREIQSHVGKTKSAWLVGMRYCQPRAGSGLFSQSMIKPFVLRHDDFSRQYGRVFDGLKRIRLTMGGSYGIWVGNDVPWVSKKDNYQLLEAGVRTRKRDMLNGMWKRMPDAGARAGFKVKAA